MPWIECSPIFKYDFKYYSDLIEKFSFLTDSIVLMNQTNLKMIMSCSTKRSSTSLNELCMYR